MRVDVLFFGVLKDVMGRERKVVELGEKADLVALLGVMRAQVGLEAELWGSLAVAQAGVLGPPKVGRVGKLAVKRRQVPAQS